MSLAASHRVDDVKKAFGSAPDARVTFKEFPGHAALWCTVSRMIGVLPQLLKALEGLNTLMRRAGPNWSRQRAPCRQAHSASCHGFGAAH